MNRKLRKLNRRVAALEANLACAKSVREALNAARSELITVCMADVQAYCKQMEGLLKKKLSPHQEAYRRASEYKGGALQ